MNLGKALDDLIRLLQYLFRFRDTYARICRWHIEQVAFIKRRHELRTKPLKRVNGSGEHYQCDNDGRPLKPEYPVYHRPVEPD